MSSLTEPILDIGEPKFFITRPLRTETSDLLKFHLSFFIENTMSHGRLSERQSDALSESLCLTKFITMLVLYDLDLHLFIKCYRSFSS